MRGKSKSYPGRHSPIVDRELFDAVQAHLAIRRATSQPKARLENVGTAPLKRLVFDADGQPMSPAYARGRDPTRRYRYYVSAPVQQGRSKPHPGKLARVPAQPLEALVLERVGRWAGLAEPGWTEIKTGLRRVEVHADAVHLWIEPARLPNASRDLELATTRLTSRLQAGETLGQDRRQPDQVRISIATCIKRRGGRACIITPDGQPLAQRRRCDQALVKGLRSAHNLARVARRAQCIGQRAAGHDRRRQRLPAQAGEPGLSGARHSRLRSCRVASLPISTWSG